jgi:hypothetical protein
MDLAGEQEVVQLAVDLEWAVGEDVAVAAAAAGEVVADPDWEVVQGPGLLALNSP